MLRFVSDKIEFNLRFAQKGNTIRKNVILYFRFFFFFIVNYTVTAGAPCISVHQLFDTFERATDG